MDSIRIQKLKSQISQPCFIDNVVDLYYLTGFPLSKGRLFVSSKEVILFVDGRYFDKAKKQAPCSVALWDEQKNINEPKICFDQASFTFEEYLSLKKSFPNTEFIPISNPVKPLRTVKDDGEIAHLKNAAKLTWRGYQHILENLKVGVTEEEMAVAFKVFCLKNQASGFSFEPIIAFGENSAYPHYRAGKAKLKKGQVVLIDIGAAFQNYCADMTRIHYFGEPNEEIKEMEHLVAGAKKKAIDHVKPGVKLGELDQMVRDEFEKHHVLDQYKHSLGHGIGLEAHENFRVLYKGVDKDIVLEPNMVFTIEPGLYRPGVGGVRIEDMIVVTEKGCENFFG